MADIQNRLVVLFTVRRNGGLFATVETAGVRQGCGLAGRRRIYYDSLVQVSQIQAEQVAAVSVTAARRLRIVC